ncbi:hypothetical protein CVT26_013129 [Gymnopilus dilepis]|uniref:Uncharacterized protein n=1 Tax=Gymnopilus dilepis TaxID=231916 RepID=A0A409WUW7_9AGAR|nr:hypothetical protein CVT26_013129 [Gymnopilus dilepis]
MTPDPLSPMQAGGRSKDANDLSLSTSSQTNLSTPAVHNVAWTGISGSLGKVSNNRSNTPSVNDQEWSGLSGDLVQSFASLPFFPIDTSTAQITSSKVAFSGISDQFLGPALPVEEDSLEDPDIESSFFWRMQSFERNAVHTEPDEESDVSFSDEDNVQPRYYRTEKSSKLVRGHTQQLTGAKVDVPTATGHPTLFPTQFEVNRYAATGDPQLGPKASNFKIELSEKFATQWNKRLIIVLADDFIACRKYGYDVRDHEKICKAFRTHLKLLRKKFLQSMEDDIPQNQLDRDKARARDARRRSLFSRRINICKHYIDDPSIQKFLRILKDLNYKICSGDETAHERGKLRYAIVQPKWRNPQLHFQFRILDRLHLSTRITEPEHRFTRGAAPRVRVTTDRIDHTDPIPGLPQNFYCPVYLSSLPKYRRDALKVQPPCDITLSEEIKQFVYSTVAAICIF